MEVKEQEKKDSKSGELIVYTILLILGLSFIAWIFESIYENWEAIIGGIVLVISWIWEKFTSWYVLIPLAFFSFIYPVFKTIEDISIRTSEIESKVDEIYDRLGCGNYKDYDI